MLEWAVMAPQSYSISNLKLLFSLRCLAIVFQVIFFWVAYHYLRFSIDPLPFFAEMGVLIILSSYLGWKVIRSEALSVAGMTVQLAADVTALAAFIVLTGGIANPFTGLFLIQVILAAILLPSTFAWLISGLTIAYYVLIASFPLPISSHSHAGRMIDMHLYGMLANHILCTLLVAFFGIRMMRNTHARDRQLQQQRHLLNLGVYAAQVAHELSTPLTTLSILASEWDTCRDASDFSPKIQRQIDRCKELLTALLTRARLLRSDSGNAALLHDFFESAIRTWRSRYPDIEIDCRFHPHATVRIAGLQILETLIHHILDNAADAGATHIWISLGILDGSLRIRLLNNGDPISFSLDTLVDPGFSTKSTGSHLGMGLYMSDLIVDGLGGSWTQVFENDRSGFEIVLPKECLI